MMVKAFISGVIVFALINASSCLQQSQSQVSNEVILEPQVSLIVLGTIQDGGSPHIGCQKECCKELFINPDPSRKVVSLGLVDHENNRTYLFEATPDLPAQMKILKETANAKSETPDGIFLTHAHIGHYAGLMYLGKESMNAQQVSVFAMPGMQKFLNSNGPWDQLVKVENIKIQALEDSAVLKITSNISIQPITVPHRDEYSETVGYKIFGPQRSVLFIPDIDKWEKWNRDIVEEIQSVDIAFLDATFFDGEEIGYRDISEIPHPFVIESIEKFKHLPPSEKSKVQFIHFNHTNPVINPKSEQYLKTLDYGFNVAQFREIFQL